MLEITCDIISTFLCVLKMADFTEATSIDSEETAIVPKKKVVSPVWDHFGQRVDSEGKVLDSDTAVCHRCHCNIRASGGNTYF